MENGTENNFPNKDQETQKLTKEIEGIKTIDANVKTLESLIRLDKNNPKFPLDKVLPPVPQSTG